MRNVLLLLFFSISIFVNAQSGGGIKGRVAKGPHPELNYDSVTYLDSVKVTLHFSSSTDSLAFLTTTDSKGEFQFRNVPNGVYLMHMEKQGFIPCEYKGVIVSRNCITYFDNPPIELVPIGYVAPKPKKVAEKKTPHKKKHHY